MATYEPMSVVSDSPLHRAEAVLHRCNLHILVIPNFCHMLLGKKKAPNKKYLQT